MSRAAIGRSPQTEAAGPSSIGGMLATGAASTESQTNEATPTAG